MRAISIPIIVLCLAAMQASAQSPPPVKEIPRPVEPTSSVPSLPDDPDLPEKIEATPSPESAPTVNIRRLDNGDVVEEYRLNGQLYEVRVTPRVGPSYSLLDTNGDGMLDRRDSIGPVAPVYWTLYKWN